MVCVPCFIIPVLLFIWRLVIVPIYQRFFGKKDPNKKEPEFPFECKGGVCPIKRTPQGTVTAGSGEGDQAEASAEPKTEDKKSI